MAKIHGGQSALHHTKETKRMNEEKIRKELHECIDKYGLRDVKTIRKSQELDKIIAKIMVFEINLKGIQKEYIFSEV